MRFYWKIYLVLAIVLLLAACTSPEPTHSPISPLPSSPVSTPPKLSDSEIVPFRLTKPIVEGMDTISGTGPAGVPIVIADVTFMGEPLGASTIRPDGTFEINVPVLEKSHRIGLAIGSLEGTRWKPEDFADLGYRGDNAMQVPQVAFFYDTAMVKEK